jgi:hypothetical protein
MKTLMILAAVLVMTLVMALPAFAETAVGGSVGFVDCDQVQVAVTQQVNAANDQDLAGVSQQLWVSQDQVLACSDSVAAGRDLSLF